MTSFGSMGITGDPEGKSAPESERLPWSVGAPGLAAASTAGGVGPDIVRRRAGRTEWTIASDSASDRLMVQWRKRVRVGRALPFAPAEGYFGLRTLPGDEDAARGNCRILTSSGVSNL